MTEKQTIIHMYRVDNCSVRKIAQTVGRSRNTVRRIIREYLGVVESPSSESSLDDYLAKRPSYEGGGRRPWVLTPEIRKEIDGMLAMNERRRASGMRKQVMLVRDIYEHLISSGHSICYSSVTRYVRKKAEESVVRPREAFIRQSYEPGYGCEFDWGEVKLYLDGTPTRFFMAVFTMCHSNHRLAYLYRHQDTLAFMESHRDYFRAIRGVPHVMVYDNMRTAVKSFVGTEKTPTDALSRMSTFYRYSYRFCNARKGNEKGHVERSVEVVRRKAFSFDVRFRTIDEAQAHLTRVCGGLNCTPGSQATEGKALAVSEDLAALQPLGGDMGCFTMSSYTVDKWSTISVNKSHYSVPDSLVGASVDVKMFSERLEVYSGGTLVASHQRFYANGGWSVRLEHYLHTMLHKPGSVAGSEAMRQVPERIRRLFASQFADDPKDFVSMMLYAKEKGCSYDDILRAYDLLKARGIRKVSGDQIKALLGSSPEQASIASRAHDSQEHCIMKGTESLLDGITGVMGSRARTEKYS